MKYLFLLFLLVAPSSYAQSNTLLEKWEVESSVDDFTDEKVVTALVVSETGFEDGFIHYMCSAESFEFKIGAGEYIGDKDIYDNVMYRVDQETPKKTTMKTTSKRYVYFNDLKSVFTQDIMNGTDSVLIQLTSYDFDKSKARFSLDGAKEAIQQVLDACSK